jgi:acetyl-CoA acetyltransferase
MAASGKEDGAMGRQAKSAIVGLGITEMGKVYGRSANSFALEAIRLALEDAGLAKDQLDGLLINAGVSNGISLSLQNAGGFRNLRLLNHMNAAGSTAIQMVMYASLAVREGMANYVACVFADVPLQAPGQSSGAAYGGAAARAARPDGIPGWAGLNAHYGYFGVNIGYAMAARRHMALYGTTSEQLGAIAVAERQWAAMNPKAQMRDPITIEDHQASRWIVEPLHLLDCCLVSNGAVAVIVTSVERARDLRSQPAYVIAMAQGHPGDSRRVGDPHETQTGAVIARESLYGQLGITAKDIGVCSLYDCYTYTVLVTLEDYGFCGKGEGGAFVEDGRLGPGGSLPTNTGGGELSAFYMWGMTPLSEGVIQARGSGGDRQVANNDLVLVTGNGGILDYHGGMILSPRPS